MRKLLSFFAFLFITIVCISQGTAVDIDGNVYRTVLIGDQEWFAENLKTTKLNDGTLIRTEKDSLRWLSITVPGYCWYKNDSIRYKPEYGALYNRYAASNDKLCPAGWRVPSKDDFFELTRSLDPDWTPPILLSEIAGSKMKEIGNTHWAPYVGITSSNVSGFSARPGGCRGWSGWYNASPYFGYFWASDNWSLALRWATDRVFMGDNVAPYVAISIRCVRQYTLPLFF